MKEIIDFELSGLLLLLLIPIGIMIYFLLRLVKINILNNRFNKRNKNYFILFEIIIWLVFGVWALKLTFSGTYYYSFLVLAILAILLLLIGWFILKDFVAGVILKLSDNYQKGQFFRLNNIEGHIAKINYLHMNIKQGNDEVIKIPFSKILGSVHHKSSIDDKTKPYKIKLTVNKKESLDSTRDSIRKTILLSAGVNIKREPLITVMESSEKEWLFEITYFILDEQYCELIENNLRSVF
jgi:small-conductance mechanosensitive channel